jgi:hypothetical protein
MAQAYFKDDLQKFLNDEYLKPEENQSPIFIHKNQTIENISKI